MNPFVRRTTLLALGLIHAGLIAHTAWVKSPGVDEVGHLAAGLSHVAFGTFDLYRVNPPLHRLPAGVVLLAANPRMEWDAYQPGAVDRSEFNLGAELAKQNPDRYRDLVFLARIACLPWAIFGLGMCYVCGRDLYGPAAGLFAAGIWAFCPETIAHGAMVTPDIAGASFGLLAAYAFWRWLRRPGWVAATLAGVAVGLAWLSKFTWIVLLPAIWPLLALVWLWRDRADARRLAVSMSQVAGMFVVALLLLNAGYGFEDVGRPLGEFEFRSVSLGGESARGWGKLGNRFRETPLESLPVPLPRNVLLGIDVQKEDFENGIRSYLNGRWEERGWWYYYIYATAFKLPIGLWLLAIFAVCRGRFRRDELAIVSPGVALFVLVSAQTGFNHHLRYILPALPFLFVFIGRLVAGPAAVATRLTRAAVAGAFVWLVAACLWVHPHELSYFNELAGGPRNGHAHLVDSNIDWGQDLWLLKKWLDENRHGRPLGFAYFSGLIYPQWFGINHGLPPDDPRPGLYAVSVNYLRGIHFGVPDGRGGRETIESPRWTYFQEFEPVATAGYSIYIYDLSPEEVNRVRRRLGLEPLPQ
ncbi:MAG: glycosyltransferase family 39 protein [Planctomycetaceae bacterium]